MAISIVQLGSPRAPDEGLRVEAELGAAAVYAGRSVLPG